MPRLVVARQRGVDALAGGPLAAKVGGPLLLTEPASLDGATQAELTRVLPTGGTVYVLGGYAAISQRVRAQLQALGYVVHALAGRIRFDTAVAIAGALGSPSTVFEATGLNFPDALSAGPVAALNHGAILLTDGSKQNPATASYLAAHPGAHLAVGGPACQADPSATCVAGANRYATSAMLASDYPSPQATGVATGLNFPDALAAGPDMAAHGGPLLLVAPSGAMPSPVSAQLAREAPTVATGYIYGGTAAVSPGVGSELDREISG
jgi:hypothetical protein